MCSLDDSATPCAHIYLVKNSEEARARALKVLSTASRARARVAVGQVNEKEEHGANFTPTWANCMCVTGSAAFRLFSFARHLCGGRIFLRCQRAGWNLCTLWPWRNRTLHESNLVLCQSKINYTRAALTALLCSPRSSFVCLCVDECWKAPEKKRDALLFFSRR